MKHLHHLRGLAVTALACPGLSAQTILSDFSGPSTDGWTGSINGTTVFANGFTAVTGADLSGNGVLNLSDGGFGGGALRTYSGLATSGFLTFTVQGRIVTDPGSLTPTPNANPGQMGSSFGVAAGNSALADQDFGYSASLSTAANNTGQAFTTYAATVRADGSGDYTTFFTPDQNDNSVGSGTWVAQFDDVGVLQECAAPSVLSSFDSGTDGWASITPSNAPFGSAFTSVSQTGGELVLGDSGFTGGAFRTYAGAASGAGVHLVLADVRIVSETSGVLTRSRFAAAPGGTTTDFSDLSFSQSFATAGDDTGQAVQTVAVPVITNGASDITVYLLSDYDGSVGSGTWEIRIDNVRVAALTPASTSFSAICTAGPHSFGGPTLDFSGSATLGGSIDIIGSNRSGDALCALMLGFEIAPLDLSAIGAFPGAKLCIDAFATIPCTSSPTSTLSFPILPIASGCGVGLDVQWLESDLSQPLALPIGSSQAGRFIIGS